MKKSLIAIATAGLTAASVNASTDANTFYIGAKSGLASFRGDLHQLDSIGNAKRNSITYGGFVGYQISNNIAVEAGYDYFGHLKLKGKNTNSNKPVLKHVVHGAHLSLKGNYEVAKNLNLFAKSGIALINNKYKTFNTGQKQYTKSTSKHSGLLLGIGAEYSITPSLSARVEYQWLQNASKPNKKTTDNLNLQPFKAHIGALTAGFTYRFGQGAETVIDNNLVTKRFAFGTDVLFDFGKANLKPEAINILQNTHKEMLNLGLNQPNIQVSGYTDRIGNEKANLVLSQRRAESVANYIASKGIAAENITAIGYGKANPITGKTCNGVKGRNSLIACLAPDRRVEIQIQGTKEIVM